jgi:hypothetical protein
MRPIAAGERIDAIDILRGFPGGPLDVAASWRLELFFGYSLETVGVRNLQARK